MRRRWTLLAVASALLTATLATLTPAHAAGGSTALPFASFFRIAVDPERSVALVSGGPGTDALAIFGFDGSLQTTVPLAGPSGMALVGDELYVAEADAPDIAVLDMTTDPPHVSRTIDVGSFTQPRDLVVLDGRVWFFTANGLVSAATDGTDLQGPFPVNVTTDPRFADGLSTDSHLLMYEAGSGWAVRYTATIPPKPIKATYGGFGGYQHGDIDIVPGAATAIVGQSDFGPSEVRLADSAVLRTYTSNLLDTAVAVSRAHGGIVAAGGWGYNFTDDVYTYRLGSTPSTYSVDLDPERVMTAGLAWSPSGEQLFAIAIDNTFGGTPTFHVLTPTGLPDTEYPMLTVTPSATDVALGGAVDATVHLEGGDTNRDVILTTHPFGGDRTVIGGGTVDVDGNLTVSGIVPPSATTLTAAYAGDGSWSAASAAVVVRVGSTSDLDLNGDVGQSGHYQLFGEQPIRAIAEVTPAVGGGTGVIDVQIRTKSGWRHKLTMPSATYSTEGRFRQRIYSMYADRALRARLLTSWTSKYDDSVSPWRYFRFLKAST